MNDEVKDLVIANMEISTIRDSDLEAAFLAVVNEHKEVVASIHQSMTDADEAYRKYLDSDYEPDEQEAKKDRATLNKAEKNIQEKFAALKTAYEKPLLGIEANIKSIRGAIKEASGVVDSAVKTYETKQQARKKTAIEEYFATKKFDLTPLERLFDSRWLNKGAKLPQVKKELDAKIAEVFQNIEVLEQIPEHGPMAKALYLENMDMAAAMRQVNTIKANAEKLAREQVEREERKLREQVAENRREQEREELDRRVPDERTENLARQALDIPEKPPIGTPPRQKMIEYTCRFWGKTNDLRIVHECMSAHNVGYEKTNVRVID
jgi:hypothetical protein